jgi:HEPN domain-containing protein
MQRDIIEDIFVRTADENYITARWCAFNSLQVDFFWLSVHALEKYMKAVILVNGGSVVDKSHDIVELFDDVKSLAPTLIPDVLKKPEDFIEELWYPNNTRDFVSHLFREGNAHNRYLLYGFLKHFADLPMLDRTVFIVRRLICSLDEPLVSQAIPDAPTTTHRQWLELNSNYAARLNMPLDIMIQAKGESPLRHAALNQNHAFAPADFPHVVPKLATSSRNPVLVRRILEPLKSDDSATARLGMTLAQWTLNNIKLPGSKHKPGILQQIRQAMENARKKHPDL